MSTVVKITYKFKNKVKTILILSLLILLSTSSFFLTDYLTVNISSGQFSQQQFQFAVKKNNIAALKVAIARAELHSIQWQTLARALAKTQGLYAYQLALFFQQQQLNAPINSSSKTTLAYQQRRAIFWFKQAIKLNYKLANIALAQHYYEDGQYQLAQQLLLLLPLNDVTVLPLKMRLAIATGNSDFVASHWQMLMQQSNSNPKNKQLVENILTFNVLNNPLTVTGNDNLCQNSIQLFATNLVQLNKLAQLVSDFKQKPLSKYVCFAAIRYIPLPQLACSHKKEQTIQCEESIWKNYAKNIASRFIGVMVPQGGANVHLGILYLDANDDVDVFSHEVSHLLGFVDEYPLPKNHKKCAQVQTAPFSHNVAVFNRRYQGKQKVIRAMILKQVAWRNQIADTTPILQRIGGTADNKSAQWQVGTPAKYQNLIGIFPANSCKQQPTIIKQYFQAFKALATRSHLEYFEQALPASYLALLAKQENVFLMPSFHYNIALALPEADNAKQVQYWLLKATTRESNSARKQKITQGDF